MEPEAVPRAPQPKVVHIDAWSQVSLFHFISVPESSAVSAVEPTGHWQDMAGTLIPAAWSEGAVSGEGCGF